MATAVKHRPGARSHDTPPDILSKRTACRMFLEEVEPMFPEAVNTAPKPRRRFKGRFQAAEKSRRNRHHLGPV